MTVIARRGPQFLDVTTPGAKPGDLKAKGRIVDLSRPDLDPIEMPVQTILKQGYWEPADDADLAEAQKAQAR